MVKISSAAAEKPRGAVRTSFGKFSFTKILQNLDKITPHDNNNNNKCVSRTDTNPPFAFQTAFPRGTDFSVSTGRVKKLHTLLVSLYF